MPQTPTTDSREARIVQVAAALHVHKLSGSTHDRFQAGIERKRPSGRFTTQLSFPSRLTRMPLAQTSPCIQIRSVTVITRHRYQFASHELVDLLLAEAGIE